MRRAVLGFVLLGLALATEVIELDEDDPEAELLTRMLPHQLI